MKTQNLAIEYANKVQAYYPGQDYNTPSIMEFASLIHEPNGKILDIGCGDGQLLRILSERYNDLSLSGLTVSKEESEACSPVFDVRVGDMHQLPWDDASFDIVTARHSLEHSISPLIVLFEINRVLKLGGRAYVVVPAPASDWVIKWADHFSVLPRQMWEKLFVDAGFEIESYCEGTWIASYSMVAEPEYRFSLRKIRDLLNKRIFDDRSDDLFEPSQSITGADIIASKRIVAVLHNLVLFDTIRPLLERFRQEVKIIVPEIEAIDFQEMAKHTVAEITKHGFEVEISKLPAEIRCDIELSPYPYTSLNVSEARWRVRYMYGLAKEAWNFSLHNTIYYDFAMSFGEYDTSILSALTSAYPIGNMKIRPVLPRSKGKRPTLLYLPTYGPVSSIEKAFEALMELRIHYMIVSKSHHGTSFLEPERVAMLRELSDEYYDHATPLADLLETADVVLSDGSGAIFDAIAAGVPVAVFQPKVFSGLGGTESLEERLCRERIIPSTNDPVEIGKVIGMALEQGVQYHNDLRNMLFISLGSDAVDRAEVFLGGLLSKNCCVPPAFLAARENLRKCVERSSVESKARKFAEQQLHETYQRLTMQLLTDVKRNALAIVEREGQIAGLNQALAEREKQITGLNQTVTERGWQIASLNQGITKTERQLAERDQRLQTLTNQLMEKEQAMRQLQQRMYWKRHRIADKLAILFWYVCHPKQLLQFVKDRARQLAQKWLPTSLKDWIKRVIFRQGLRNALSKSRSRLYREDEQQMTVQKLTLSNQERYLIEKTAQNSYLTNYIAIGLDPAHFDFIHENLASKAVKWDKVVIYPLSYPMELTQRPDHILRNFAENGYQCVVLSIDSNTPFFKEIARNIYLTNLFAGVISYFSNKKIIFYITYPFYSYILNHLQRPTVVYDVLDDLSVFSLNCEAMRTDHMELLGRSDITLFSSEELFNANCNDVKGHAYLVSNGVWANDFVLEFGHAQKNINFRRHPNEYVIGYHGAITELLDWELLVKLIEIPDVRLVLIGPLAHFDSSVSDNIQALQQRVLASNQVTHIQPVPYLELKYHLNGFDAAIIPFVVNEKTHPVSPLKLFEYMAMGLKVFATPTKTLSRYSQFISVGDSSTIPARVREMIGSSSNILNKIDYSAVLSDVDWGKQLAPVISLLEEEIAIFKYSVRSAKTVDIINVNFYDWDGVTLYKGGAERYVYDLARMLKEDGWSPRILQNANNPFEVDFRGIPVIGIQTASGHDLRGMSKKYREVCRDSDLVIASPVDLACELWGLNVIGINHGIHWDHKYKKLETTTLNEYRNIFDALKTSSAVVAVDTNFINWVRTYDYDLGRKLTYIPNYFEGKVFSPNPKSFSGNLRILYPRRLYEARGIFITLKAFDYLFNRHEGIELHLVGQAEPEDGKIVSKFIEKHKNRVIWEEFDLDDMYKAYQTSHITLVPTIYSEGTSLSCLEAMATNNAIIATNIGGLPNLVIDGFNGLLIEPTVEALIQSLESLFADRVLMQNMASNGIEMAAAFEKNRWVRRWRNVIMEISR